MPNGVFALASSFLTQLEKHSLLDCHIIYSQPN